jgi:hypothetical protein
MKPDTTGSGRPFWALLRTLALSGVPVAFLAFATAPATAAPPIAAGVRAGTSGVGVDLVARASDRLHVRLAASRFGYDTTISTSSRDYDTEIDLASGLLLLDWYPGAGAFRVSLGAGWNGTEAEVSAPLVEGPPPGVPGFPNLPGFDFDLGTVSGTARGEEVVPALLVGWGNPFRGGRWKLSFEVGAIYQGEPEVDLTVDTSLQLPEIPGLPGGQDLLELLAAQEERELERELEDYTVLPVVSLSLTYSF